VASHELRTPLAPLQLRLQSLQHALDRRDFEASSEYVKSAGRQVRRLTTLVSDILDVARMRDGDLKLELEQVDLSQGVREVAADYLDAAARHGCSLDEVRTRSVGPARTAKCAFELMGAAALASWLPRRGACKVVDPKSCVPFKDIAALGHTVPNCRPA
jgi:signal transduction histidine kinase